MGDPPRSQTVDFYGILGIPKSASLKDVSKAYKSLVTKWHPDKNPSNKDEAQVQLQQINEAFKALNEKKIQERPISIDYEPTTPSTKDLPSPGGSSHHDKSMDESFFSRPSILLKSLSKKSRTSSPNPTQFLENASWRSTSPMQDASRSKSAYRSMSRTHSPNPNHLSKSTSRRTSPLQDASRSKSTCKSMSRTPSSNPNPLSKSTSRRTSPTLHDSSRSKSTCRRSASETEIPSLTRSLTKKGNTTPIVYSQSTAWRIPSPIERKLACTLEELCHGCVKKIKITRDIISNGIIKQVEEILKIKVKPGWKKGTKITFEGKGDERPGYLPADIIFLIDEKRHPLFTREGDDLEYGLEIPLVQALTGCSISVPLLGGEKMRLSFDEIIFPRFEKVIPGQGMPTKREGHRGDLRIKFFVEFPLQLSDEQRSEASRILQDCS
ncbi:chaperone protein DnaJ 1 [Ricinus communis]|uniref:chaperone protein DnaJ 1 n=1 Tax=Ricinus communis TaxID=3988 RepID=UPI000772207B|nr:chaperone protein DnaJ 1 [Ricinus communis]|eukprot:XP_015581096.1 uncharacterized protein LOC8278563 [Ricinus communis]